LLARDHLNMGLDSEKGTLSHYARLTLESMKESQAAGEALVAALASAPEPLKLGIIASLAERGEKAAVSSIATYIDSDNGALAKAATEALGRIGGKKAASAIRTAHARQAEQSIRLAQQYSLLDAASDITPDDAHMLMREGCNPGIRAGAFIRLATVDPKRARNALVEILNDLDDPLRAALLRAGMESGDVLTRDILVADLKSATWSDQLVLLGAIQDLKLKAYERDVIALLPATKDKPRDAAIHTLAVIGGRESFEPLYEVYRDDPSEAVTFAITRLPVPSVDAELLKTVAEDSDQEVRLAAMTPLMLRNPVGAIELFNRLAGPGQPDTIRKAAYRTLESIGNVDSCNVLVATIVQGDGWQRLAQTSLKRLCVAAGREDDIWQGAFKPALDSTVDDDAREALLAVLDGVACNGSLSYLKGIIADPTHTLRPAALRSLARWPQFAAGEVWLGVMVTTGALPEDIAAAKRGILRALSQDDIVAHANLKLKLAAKAIQQARTLDFKQAVLARYDAPSQYERRRMKELWKPLLADTNIVEQVRALMD
jgi:HEAT repeat protein